MSDERPVFARWRYPFAKIEGKKILIVEFFEARHWRIRHGMKVFPSLKDWGGEEVDWSQMYRLRINGKWFGPKKLSFFTVVQAARIVTRILHNGKITDCAAIEMIRAKNGDVFSVTDDPVCVLPDGSDIRFN